MKSFFFSVILLSGFGFADQHQWTQKDPANQAAQILKIAGHYKSFCAPCGDKSAVEMPVGNVSIVSFFTKHPLSTLMKPRYWQYRGVMVNGVPVDLAYVYVKQGGSWVNLAMLVNLKTTFVPRDL